MLDAITLCSTFDARVWAKEFLEQNPECTISFEIMIGWFANSLMAGYDHAKREKSS